jgi:hypothetical protein
VTDPLLQALRDRFPYVTRFYGQLSPEEMTVDPVFDFNGQLPDVSNIHDLTQRTDFYACPDTRASNIEPVNDQSTTASQTPSPCVLGLAMLLSGGLIFVSRRKG